MKATHHVPWVAASRAAREGCVLQSWVDWAWNRLGFGDGCILPQNGLTLGPLGYRDKTSTLLSPGSQAAAGKVEFIVDNKRGL